MTIRIDEVEADWIRDVEEFDEKTSILHELSGLLKERRYINDPSEAPEGVEVQEGERGGLWYETEGSDASDESITEAVQDSIEELGYGNTDVKVTENSGDNRATHSIDFHLDAGFDEGYPIASRIQYDEESGTFTDYTIRFPEIKEEDFEELREMAVVRGIIPEGRDIKEPKLRTNAPKDGFIIPHFEAPKIGNEEPGDFYDRFKEMTEIMSEVSDPSEWQTPSIYTKNDLEKIRKERRYVSDPSEVPDEYEIQEGEQGGVYYEPDSGDDSEESGDDGSLFSGDVDLSRAQQEFIQRQPEVVSMLQTLQRKFGPKITNSFMRNASQVIDRIDPDAVNQAAALFLSEDGFPDVSIGLQKSIEGKKLADEAVKNLMKQNQEVLEIKDFYRMWVKSPEDAPEGQDVLYDKQGDPDGNHYYYEIPFQTKTRIDVGEDVNKELSKAMQEKARKEYPERVDLVDMGIPEKDLTLVDKVQDQIQNDMPIFGKEIRKTNPSILQDVDSGLTLLHLYKQVYDEGGQYEAFLKQIQKELERRGIQSFEKVSKARRYIDTPEEAPSDATVEEGERGGLYYETESSQGEVTEDTSSGTIQEFAQSMAISEWPEEHMRLSEDAIRYKTEEIWERADSDVAEHVLNHFNGFRNKSPQSAYGFNEAEIVMRADAGEETISHEFGHAFLGSYGFTVNDIGNMLAHFYSNEVPEIEFGQSVTEVAEGLVESRLNNPNIPEEQKEQTRENLEEVRDRYEDIEFRREDMHVFVPDDWDNEAPEKVQNLAEAVNTAWDRQINAAKSEGEDPSEYYISKPYSATNAHETMAMTHEAMQSGIADPSAMENLYQNQQELLKAYTEIFEPADTQKDMLNELFKSFGANDVWDEVPYPEAEGVLQE